MPKFRVYAIYTASKYLGEFEAASEDEAKDMADETGDPTVSLCHQCAHEIDLGDVTDLQAEPVEA